MIGLLGMGRIAREQEKARPGRRRRAVAVLGILAVLLAAVGIMAAPASAGTGYAVTATIGLSAGLDGVAVDPSTHAVYVSNIDSGTMSVIDGTTDTVTATIGVGDGPTGVGVDPSTHTVYVANQFSNSVSVIDEATNTVTATIGVGLIPSGVGVDPSTHTVYVTDAHGNSVSVIDGATNALTATIGVGAGPVGVGVDPSTHTVYVANESSGTVSVIDGATNAVTATIGVSTSPVWVGVDPSTHAVYIGNYNNNNVSVIDGTTNTVTATIGVGSAVQGVGVDPSTHAIYAANSNSGTVSVIDGTTNTVTATIGVGNVPYGVGVDPSTHAVYVANEFGGTVSVITPPQPFGTDQTITKNGNSTVTTPAFSTTGPRLLVAFTSSDGPSTRQTTTVTGAGLTWVLVKRANAKGGTAEIWTAQATGPLTNATVTSTPKTPGYDQSLTVVAFTGASGIGASASAGKSGGLPSVSLNTTQPGSWVFGVGEDYSNDIARNLGTGQSLISQWVDPGPGETFWVQDESASTPAAGTAVTINDTAPKGDTWNLAAAEILSAAS
jgi:YVTN family beta-propeller protein